MKKNIPQNLIVILGPTAAGKTRLAANLANELNGEIISADSRQVYRGMNIGTGKDYEDYIVNGNVIPYHLIDVAEPSEEFNLFRFKELFNEAFIKITDSNKLPFLVGGTGLFIHAVLKNYNLKKINFETDEINNLNKLNVDELKNMLLSLNPKPHNITDLVDKKRIINAILIQKDSTEKTSTGNLNFNISPFVLGVKIERSEIKKRITERLKKRLQTGMIEEVEQLVTSGISYEKLNFFGLEYKFIGQYLNGELSYNDMYQKLNSAIHNFAKRQMTWFRKMEKEGIEIFWLNGADMEEARKLITTKLFSK